MELELPPLQREPQFVFEGQAADHLRVFFGTVVQLSLAGGACVAQRHFRVLHQRVGILAVPGKSGEARSDRDRDLPLLDDKGFAEQRSRMFVGRRQQILMRAAAQIADHGEGSAAEVGDMFGLGETALEPVRNMLQEQIARPAAVGVVDQAQPLDVDDGDREARAATGRVVQHPGQSLAEQGALGETGLRIEVRQKLDRRILLQVLQREGEVPGHLPQHPQFLLADGPGVPRSQHDDSHRRVVHEKGQCNDRFEPQFNHCPLDVERAQQFGRVVADEGGAGSEDLAGDAGRVRSRLRNRRTKFFDHILASAAPGNGLNAGGTR